MTEYVIIFVTGAMFGALVTFLLLKSWADKQVRDRIDIHSRLPKEWSSEMHEYYYDTAAKSLVEYVTCRQKSYGGWAPFHGYGLPDQSWLMLFEFFRVLHSCGLGIKVFQLNEDGQDLEKDPDKAHYDLSIMRQRTYPDFHVPCSY